MLLPPDLLEWLPANHLALFYVDAVASLDTSAVVSCYELGGVGRQAYDPQMLTTLLMYAYSQGVMSSRKIEQRCHTDVAFRVICANNIPDHCTISRFRSRCGDQLSGLFGAVLGLCHQAGMVKVGVVSIDGTKIAAQASLQRNYSQEHLRRLAAELVDQAGHVDDDEDDQFGDSCGDELPQQLRAGPDRVARLRGLRDRMTRVNAAVDQVETRLAQVIDEDVDTVSRKLQAARRRQGWCVNRVVVRHAQSPAKQGRPRIPVEDHAQVRQATQRVDDLEHQLDLARGGQGKNASVKRLVANTSDPDSKPMPIMGGKAFVQGYNGQVAVSADHVIIAADVCQTPNDQSLFVPMMNQAVESANDHLGGAQIEMILADAGYCTENALSAPGPYRLIATGRNPAKPKSPRTSTAVVAMVEKLQPGTPHREIYKQRACTVETVFAHLKHTLGFTRFTRRGLSAARNEWILLAMVFNLRRLAVHNGIPLQ